MGWAGGGELLDSVAKLVMPKIETKLRKGVAQKLICLFENYDCDTIYEVSQKDVADAYAEAHPLDEE